MSSIPSGWYRLGIDINSAGAGVARFNNQTFNFNTALHSGAFGVAYRENLQLAADGTPDAIMRPPTFVGVPEPASVVLLALGIAANVAIFTVVHAVLLQPLPYPDADRIVTVRHNAPGLALPELEISPGLVELYRDSARTLTRMAAYEPGERNLTGSGHPERITVASVTPEIFDVLGVRPMRGRAFHAPDARKDAPLVVILTDALWQSDFGSDPNIVGRRVELNGVRYSHILDPRTGRPLAGRRQATAVAPDATTSDMLATALCVLSPVEGRALVSGMPNTAAMRGAADGDGPVEWVFSPRWPQRHAGASR